MLISLTCAVYPGISVFSEEEKDLNTQYAPWTLKLGGGIGKIKETTYGENSGILKNYRISAEYNPRYFGFEFGISRSYAEIDFHKDREITYDYLVAQFIGASQHLNASVINGALSKDAFRDINQFNLTFLDIGPTFHFRPGKTFDPYISIGAGTSGFDSSASYRGYGRLGLRLNFDRFYVFTEAEGSAINRFNERNGRTHYNEYGGMLGVGFYFGGEESVKKEEPVANLSSP
ncbi:hypothetical protein AB3N59_18435 [Leptospira sp. WS92.C1]